MIRTFFLIVFLYILVLFQTSFFAYFPSFFGFVFNWVAISVILINLFEKQEENAGILSAVMAGFFLDIFSKGFPVFFGISTGFTGFYIIILTAISVFIKFFLKKYFDPAVHLARRPKKQRF